jgi:hypothetical protein
MAALVVGLGAVVTTVVLFYPHGRADTLPDPLEAVFPLPGDVVVRQTAVEVDLPVGYDVVSLEVDGSAVPEGEIAVRVATGEFSWQPSPGASMQEWSAGEHTVRVRWERTSAGTPDPGEYLWSFRVS